MDKLIKTKHPLAQVQCVRKKQRGSDIWIEQQLANYRPINMPDGWAYIQPDGRILVNKKRGEKVFVRYTSVFAEEF